MNRNDVTIEEILNKVDLTVWATKRAILTDLHIQGIDIQEKKLRDTIKESNLEYLNFEREYFIAHSASNTHGGFKLTTCLSEEYELSLRDYKSRIRNLINMVKLMEQRRGEEFNLKLLLEEENLI